MAEHGHSWRVDGRACTELPADDRGLAYGDGVFRTLCVDADGRIVAWGHQYARLAEDCRRMQLGPPACDVLTREIEAVAADHRPGVVKVMVTRGSGGRGYTPPSPARPRLIVSGHALPAPPPEHLDLALADVALAEQPLLAGIKHLNRLEQVFARRECATRGVADLAMLDTGDRVIATTMRNLLFAAGDGRWFTPDLSRCGIMGATRQRLLETAGDSGPAVIVQEITREALPGFTGAIACNSVGGIIPVTRLGDTVFPESTAMAALARGRLAASA